MTTLRPSSARPHTFTAALAAALLLVPGCFEPDPDLGSSAETDDDAPGSTSQSDPTTSTTGGPGEPSGTTGDQPDPSAEETGANETSTSGGEDGEGSSSGGDGSTTTGADVTPPMVLSITPDDGSTAVMDETVTIEFDEPMDTASVEAAFPTASGFTWNDDDTAVEFELPFPFTDTASGFEIIVPDTATDLAGNGLAEEVSVGIDLAALHVSELDYDPDLTGNSTGTWFFAGDTEGDTDRLGGASFPLGALPDHGSILALRSAHLLTQVIDTAGTPEDGAAGGFVIDHVEFASRGGIASPTMLDAAFTQFLSPADIAPNTSVDVDVSEQLEASWSADEVRFQIRVRFPDVTENGVADVAWFRRGADENDGIVHESVTEPDDGSNRLRVVVEYFTHE